MPTATVDCHDCHHVVTVPTEHITLITARGVTTYGFQCPHCQVHNIRVASTSVLAVFAREGIRPRLVLLDPPLIAGHPPTGPALTEDDHIRFGLELQALV